MEPQIQTDFRNIIFLDVDGVFNCDLFYKGKQFQDYKDANKKLKKTG